MTENPSVPFDAKFIDHLVLRTGNSERLVAFYHDVLGLPLERMTANGLVQLRAGGSLIDIVPAADRDQPGRNLEHFCIRDITFRFERDLFNVSFLGE